MTNIHLCKNNKFIRNFGPQEILILTFEELRVFDCYEDFQNSKFMKYNMYYARV